MNDLTPLIQQAVERTFDRLLGVYLAKEIAVMLSGGIDSSTVAAFAPSGVTLVTGWYDHPGCDERKYAALVAETPNRMWAQAQIVPLDFVWAAGEIVDEGILNGLRCGPGAVGQLVLADALATNGIKAIVTGEGGDELFGGYARMMIATGNGVPAGYENYVLPEDYPNSLGQILDYEWRALATLCAVDERIAAARRIQVFTPMLDPWLVAAVHQCAPTRRLGKVLLREAMEGVLPDAILARTDKAGFPVPFVAWAQDEPVRGFLLSRIGYTPEPDKPWDRQWWSDLLDSDPNPHP